MVQSLWYQVGVVLRYPPCLCLDKSKNLMSFAVLMNLFYASRNNTPRSARSYHSRTSRSPMKKVKQAFPLVLLHVTLLPIPVSYSPAIMQKVLPHHILENWKLLQEKFTKTVLGARNPHTPPTGRIRIARRTPS